MTLPFTMTIARKAGIFSFITAFLLLLGCDSAPKTATEATPTPSTSQMETGRFALQKMLVPAHFWVGDAQPVRLESTNLKESDGHDGKANFWRAEFASISKQKAEAFSWSGVSSGDSVKGVDHGAEDSYNPSNRAARAFDLNFLKVDTDKAFEVAQQHGGKQVLEKAPKTTVTYLLDWDVQSSQLRWHVIYGGSESTGKLTVLIDASSGAFLRKQ
ncbi:MAG TPA: hypothetical protein VFT65_11530 [Candidatus Angelobacter sp.]|nr:hypothetical protein [Candidatus Angelobacter sp.]